ncbi:CRISPR-associated helicase Cas3', partial [Poseidonibacter sp.]|uniref:CRISPR-associated helicase Cas3' n=1 Tax=Poseidonibacter sp. TaxID=2321188 RepID=UPI003C78729C
MEILAKKLIIDDKIITQTLEKHTNWVIEEAIKLIDEKSLKTISCISGFSKEKIVDLIFFSAYFHDVGKATYEFQNTIKSGIKSFHSLYSASVLVEIIDFEILGEDEEYINLLLVICLTHHTLLPYTVMNDKFKFLETAKDFFNNYKNSYEMYLNKKCKYKFDFKIEKNLRTEINSIESSLKYINQNHRIRTLYSYVSGILNLSDWLASARFNNNLPKVYFDILPSKNSFMKNFKFELKNFQENLSSFDKSILVEIPTGEGKTEASLLWAIKNLYDKNSKIIYTLPTQVTSNKLYERVCNLFDKKECGLIHSASKFYLEKNYEKENGVVDDFFKSEITFSKNFSKPITVSTIDSLLKFFINIGRFNITTKNFLNSVVIVDEIHCYDFKLMGFLKRFLELCSEMDVKVCLMSASIPNQLKYLLGINHYPLISDKNMFAKKANEIIKIDEELDDNFDLIVNDFKTNKNILIIRNSVKSATDTYKKLRDDYDINKNSLILYHSTFKKNDKNKKENLIFEKLKKSKEENKPFILVATQIVEISLDIDFDIMFTDNAPIDSLIQRFGRVNRKKTISNKGKIYIFKYEKIFPYKAEYLLELTFNVIQNGYFEISKYVEWLNIVYDELFENDKSVKNKIYSKFNDAYNKYNEVLKKLNGINKSYDNYDLRDIEVQKIDYLLYEDFMNDDILEKDYSEYIISLPIYYEKLYKYETQKEINYVVLDIKYNFGEGLYI